MLNGKNLRMLSRALVALVALAMLFSAVSVVTHSSRCTGEECQICMAIASSSNAGEILLAAAAAALLPAESGRVCGAVMLVIALPVCWTLVSLKVKLSD